VDHLRCAVVLSVTQLDTQAFGVQAGHGVLFAVSDGAPLVHQQVAAAVRRRERLDLVRQSGRRQGKQRSCSSEGLHVGGGKRVGGQ
jgi:hypothetical protein